MPFFNAASTSSYSTNIFWISGVASRKLVGAPYGTKTKSTANGSLSFYCTNLGPKLWYENVTWPLKVNCTNTCSLFARRSLVAKTYTTKIDLITIGINVRNKKKFAGNSFAKQNSTSSIILVLKVSVILKNSGKRLKLISVKKD